MMAVVPRALASGVALCAAAAPVAGAQIAPVPDRVVEWTLTTPARVTAGAAAEARLSATVEEFWHLYAPTQPGGGPVALRVTIVDGPAFAAAGGLRAPAPDTIPDSNFDILSQVYDDSAAFGIPFSVRNGAPAGQHTLRISVTYQACTTRYCLPPTTEELRAVVVVAAAAPTNQRALDAERDVSEAPVQATVDGASQDEGTTRSGTDAPMVVLDSASLPPIGAPASAGSATAFLLPSGDANPSLLPFLWLAVSMGALALLTPCVLPIVPITVSWFAHGAESNRRAVLRRALLYGLGMVLAFATLGIALAVLVGPAGIGRLAANPWLNLAVAGLFIGFALALLGVIRIGPTAALIERVDALARRTGGSSWGIVLMGVTFALTAFTCTAPFVGTMLVIAARGSWVWPLIGTLAFAATFALPFVVLALVPRLLALLPRSGPWFGAFKGALACVELAAAVKFLSNADLVWHLGILTRPVVLAIWIACAVAAALLLLGVFAHEGERVRPGAPRLLAAGGALLVALWLAAGLGGRRLGELEAFLPPRVESQDAALDWVVDAAGELPWILNDYESALELARRERRAVLIDFTGYTCTNCRWMEANMFPRQEVQASLDPYVRVRLYTDGRGDVYRRQQAFQETTFGTVALPLYATVRADGRPLASFLGMTRDPEEFVDFLERGAMPR